MTGSLPRMPDEPPFRVVGTRTVWQCPWFEIRRDDVVLPDGSAGVFNTLVKGDGVWIVPRTEDGRVVLLRVWRQTVGDWCWEVPAGTRTPGASPEATARDELREETGGVAAALERVGGFYTAAGVMSEEGHVFFADGVVLGTPAREPTEVHEIHVIEAATALRWARDGTMTDSNSALALLRCEDRLGRARGDSAPAGDAAESRGGPR